MSRPGKSANRWAVIGNSDSGNTLSATMTIFDVMLITFITIPSNTDWHRARTLGSGQVLNDGSMLVTMIPIGAVYAAIGRIEHQASMEFRETPENSVGSMTRPTLIASLNLVGRVIDPTFVLWPQKISIAQGRVQSQLLRRRNRRRVLDFRLHDEGRRYAVSRHHRDRRRCSQRVLDGNQWAPGPRESSIISLGRQIFEATTKIAMSIILKSDIRN